MRNQFFTLINALGVPALLRRKKKGQLTVLSLHRVTEERDHFFEPIPPRVFRQLLEYLVRHYTIINFGQLGEKDKFSKPPLVLSFDDGYYDFIEHALPILTEFGVPSNHNLVNTCLSENAVIWTQQLNDIFNFLERGAITSDPTINTLGRPFPASGNNWVTYYMHFYNHLLRTKAAERQPIIDALKTKYAIHPAYRMMTWEEAKTLPAKGVEIGNHTWSHDSLLTITSPDELQREIGNAVQEMKERLNTPISILALPNGQSNAAVLQYAEAIGLSRVLLVDDKTTTLKELQPGFSTISRIGTVYEPIPEMILRTELFHAKFRKKS